MALQTFPAPVYYPDPLLPHTTGLSSTQITIDASGEKAAFIFPLPKAGTISKVGFHVAAAATPQTLAVSLQTVDADGFPTGSLFGGSAEGTQAAPAANTSYTVTLGTGATVGASDVGDLVAAVFEFDSTAGNVRIGMSNNIGNTRVPYGAVFTSAWAKVANLVPVLWIEYDDGSYANIFCAPGDPDSHLFNSSDSPDEYGIVFTLPVPSRAVGIWVDIGAAVGSAYELILYSGTTPLQTVVCDGDQQDQSTTSISELIPVLFQSAEELDADTEYIVALRPTDTVDIRLPFIDVSAAAIWDSFGGQTCYQVSRTDQGAWTTTATTRRPMIGVILDAFDDGAGGVGGGAVFPVIGAGGLVF